ncbi:M23 family metallopeptidase [Streptomyces durmitorensis]|uniref:M23 family metallopeptidase n=1 Tax=Streptomyces durmitorensis TaxID=319947 RepID=UPI0031E02A14
MRRELSLALLTVVLITAVILPAGAAGGPAPRAGGAPVPGAGGVPGGEPVPGAGGVPGGESVPRVGGAPGGEPVPKVGGAWPVGVRPPVVRGWEPPATEYGRGHRGVDLTAPPGAVVRAAAPGKVSFAGRVAGRGVIAVELAGTGDPPLRTTYEPVRATVKKGAEVAAGEALGVLELPTAHCPGSCLHWGLLRADAYLDPLSLMPPWLLRRGASRLLPVKGVPVPEAEVPEAEVPEAEVPEAEVPEVRVPMPGVDVPMPEVDVPMPEVRDPMPEVRERGLSPARPAAPWRRPLR